MSDADAQLLLKKRARRRLVGAIAFVLLAAVVLPMVMDAAPPLPTQEVQIRIPGQEQPVYLPPAAPAKEAAAPAEKAEAAAPPPIPSSPAVKENALPAAVATTAAVAATAALVTTAASKPESKPPTKPAENVADVAKLAEHKPSEKVADKKDDSKAEKKVEPKKTESDRAAAILGGKAAGTSPSSSVSAATSAGHVILIGAYANPGNVKVLRAKLDQIGVKTYTEALNSPQGNKTRLRAGPFTSKEAAEKALDKMKRIGVGGLISAK